ncbi:MAG: NAD(P) transhydrogenase subunit alpha [Chloroflexota bacterium]
MTEVLLGAYVFFLAIIVGFEVIGRVPAMLHTPLMSGTNAIHGVVLVGAIVVAGQAHTFFDQVLGFVAVVLGSLNVFGGFAVTDRMLQMFHARRGGDA